MTRAQAETQSKLRLHFGGQVDFALFFINNKSLRVLCKKSDMISLAFQKRQVRDRYSLIEIVIGLCIKMLFLWG
jgi:hypothetical protein